ncbi:hypothetical protein CROQUDRAFT_88613 [Cronartium quercuum f. sp. fusiforme G11]|uniref:Uncharacterized protein n=1 Tax=Cronartium quercuum f. sp. fusiforme G11 TaxID=708437 RepID=A0A9P6NT29_9BASI|nr:hypothetical protein CROQUDRAFT_88613 [Cronartium quercuum f. sp. fusiforme G11]
MTSEAVTLKERIECSLEGALCSQYPSGPPPAQLRAISRSQYTGEIHLQFHLQEAVDAITAIPDSDWVASINPALKLKVDIYLIIIHGIPISFNPNSPAHIQHLMDENTGILDTLQWVLWANQKALVGNKTHSSIIIHLTNPSSSATIAWTLGTYFAPAITL